RQTGVPASVTQPSSLSVLVVSEHSLWLPRFWDSLNFKKDREFMWLSKSVLSRVLTSPKKQLESFYVSLLTHKKQSTHKSLYITLKTNHNNPNNQNTKN
ncbi:LOW QUALITY PROTEIN: hypothetical protein HID58_055385, partial [Brassica napus]